MITKEKITLRKIKTTDAATFFKMVHSSPDIEKYIPGIVHETAAKNQEYVNYLANLDFVHDFAFFVVKSNKPAGFILATQDRKNFKALNVDCFCAKEYRKHGIALKGMKSFIEFIRNDGFYSSLLLDIKKENIPSTNLAKKLGAANPITMEYMGLACFQRYTIKIK